MDISAITSAIIKNNFTNAELNSVMDAVTYARSQLVRMNKSALRVGDAVQFTSNRNGRLYKGTVEKIAIKYINVRTAFGVYRVPANMLEAI
jgi:hypothetical protein